MATNGSFKTSGYSDPGFPDHYVFTWELVGQDTTGNYSDISWALTAAGGATDARFTNVKQKYVTVNGVTKTNSEIVTTYNGTVAFSGTTRIYHNNDGTGSFSASAGGAFYRYGSYNSTGSGSWDLPDIARASAIESASDVVLGNACSIKWTPADASYKYKLVFSLGRWIYTTGIISPNRTTAYTYTDYVIPIEVANQFAARTSTMAVSLYTYSDSTATEQIGSATVGTFIVTVPDIDETAPTITMSISPVSTLASPFSAYYIQGKSRVQATMSSGAKFGAYVASNRLVVGGRSYSTLTSDYLNTSGTLTVTGIVTDSRGYERAVSTDIEVLPYGIPKIQPASGESEVVCGRCDSQGTMSVDGTHLKIKAKRWCSPLTVDGTAANRCEIRYRYKVSDASNYSSWVTLLSRTTTTTDEVDSSPISGVVSSIATNYTVQVGVVDDLGGEVWTTVIVPADHAAFHLRDGGGGAAFGKYSSKEGLECAWDAFFEKGLSVEGAFKVAGKVLLDLVHPVGSFYISESATNPSALFGGTWVRIQDRFLLAAGSSYSAGTTGGEATHTLTVDEMPKHKHTADFWSGKSGDAGYGGTPATNYECWNRPTERTTGNVQATGGGQAHNNMPPYLAVYVWKRTA